MRFHYESRLPEPSVMLVRLEGVLDSASAYDLELDVSEHLRAEEIRKVVLDVRDLTFIASSGLRVLMLILRVLTPRNGTLHLANVSKPVAMLIRMAGLEKWISIEEEAVPG